MFTVCGFLIECALVTGLINLIITDFILVLGIANISLFSFSRCRGTVSG